MDSATLPAVRPTEPAHARWRYWLLFGLGALMIVPVIATSVASLPLAGMFTSPHMQIAMIAFVGSSLPEEAARFAILVLVGLRWFGFSRPRDTLVFGLIVSVGFSCAENVFYGVSIGWQTGLLKIAVATPIHIALGVTMGGLLAAANQSPRHRRIWLVTAFAMPLMLHGVYDLVLLRALAGGDTAIFTRLSMPVVVYALVALTAVLIVLRTRHMARGANGLPASA